MSTWCRLFCALCRITCYKCCHKSSVSRPEYSVIAVGLSRSGKSTLLALLGNEETTDIEPTQGFSIKALSCPDVILNVKELGGNVEQYWGHYYRGAKGIIFVVDSSNADQLDEACNCLVKVLSSPTLAGLPLLILANKQDVAGAVIPEQVAETLKLDEIARNFDWTIHGCSSQNKDSIETGFKIFINKLVPTDQLMDNNQL